MFRFRRVALAPLVAAVFATGLSTAPAPALAEAEAARRPLAASEVGPLSALSSADRLSYTTAFDALRRGDLELARASARQAQDRVLLGQVEFERLFHRNHAATYDELAAWLETYADTPEAPRVYALALRRRPDGAPEPRRPAGVGGRTWDSVASGENPEKAARIRLNADDLSGAVELGRQTGDWWTVGLAQWRLNDFSEAFRSFERVALDPTEDPWVRAGAAFWSARAAAQSGRQDRINEYLRLAARWPASFYGQIALRQLGEEPLIENLGPRPYHAEVRHASLRAEPDGAYAADPVELHAFLQSDEKARRALAFYEVGRRGDAESAVRQGLRGAVEDTARRMWTSLARLMSSGAEEDAARIDATRYPLPVLEPEGGFTVERALVYAIARKETGFEANARSGAGAYGVMQVMPATAAELTGDRGFVSQPERLFDPAVNLRLGQAYVNRMLQLPAFQGDLLKAVASYNAGPGPMLAAIRRLGPDADPLLLIETIDVPQARDYVEKVVAAYWIYQRMLGGPLNTLDAAASGARTVPIGLDYAAPPRPTLEMALAAGAEGGR
ncbi:lytic transglycosylase domain-containing protein [Brevundimonas sp. S30B]|uniref:lytic transglycosylase domain-containing protein n=1 Tax=unclassified Brevundimonas TaxID=2622653 RepID=UPI001072CC1C|nr:MULTISPECIES: lytic transglycosylase domain-containing protein [unclassified Brevundimonas]QBX36353.1 lytic transglycosylase domain-containing protein [Brevundimonas sp. MF30-B]TFW01062.1 lytic transglycosylase domain-containing protein [Brevundimonas sp. S30B]